MPNYDHDQGICLRVLDFSETSQVATLLTRQHGLVAALAKGVRKFAAKSASAFGGPLDLLAEGDLVFIMPRIGELATLTAWQVRNHQAAIRGNLTAFYAGQIICEFTVALLSPHDPHAALYDQLLAAVDQLPTTHSGLALLAYLKCALAAAGYQARLDACTICGKAIRPGSSVRFIPGMGTVACGSCAAGAETIQVQSAIILALHRLPPPAKLLQRPPERTADAAALHCAANLLVAQCQAITDRRLRTAGLLAQIFQRPANRGMSIASERDKQ